MVNSAPESSKPESATQGCYKTQPEGRKGRNLARKEAEHELKDAKQRCARKHPPVRLASQPARDPLEEGMALRGQHHSRGCGPLVS